MDINKSAEKKYKQEYYGYYCIICKNKNIKKKEFCDFALNDFYEVKNNNSKKE